jgi:transcription termination/antitermination protein NusA
VKLSLVINELVEERGLDRDVLSKIICAGMLAAYQKKYPDLELSIEHNKKTDDLEVRVKKKVVSSVEDEDAEISLRKARNIKPKIELGDELWVPFEGTIGRVEILRAKQVIANAIHNIEAEAIYKEFIGKKGTIVLGTIHKCERVGMTIKIGDTLAFLPKSLSIPTDTCVVGYSIRALLKDVLEEPRHDKQLILDRASSEFVKRLFELEIPEVFEGLVEIKKIARIPGYKSKVVVASRDENIDPVGTCVGVGGVRIKPILKELGGEKIDVIPWTDSEEKMVANALKPAVINRVELIGDNKANVWLDEDQRSLAIGKMGQNISLASQLTGININLVPSVRPENEEELQIVEEGQEE